jgi:hypothetical protein
MQHGDMESKKVSTPNLDGRVRRPLYLGPPRFLHRTLSESVRRIRVCDRSETASEKPAVRTAMIALTGALTLNVCAVGELVFPSLDLQ